MAPKKRVKISLDNIEPEAPQHQQDLAWAEDQHFQPSIDGEEGEEGQGKVTEEQLIYRRRYLDSDQSNFRDASGRIQSAQVIPDDAESPFLMGIFNIFTGLEEKELATHFPEAKEVMIKIRGPATFALCVFENHQQCQRALSCHGMNIKGRKLRMEYFTPARARQYFQFDMTDGDVMSESPSPVLDRTIMGTASPEPILETPSSSGLRGRRQGSFNSAAGLYSHVFETFSREDMGKALSPPPGATGGRNRRNHREGRFEAFPANFSRENFGEAFRSPVENEQLPLLSATTTNRGKSSHSDGGTQGRSWRRTLGGTEGTCWERREQEIKKKVEEEKEKGERKR